MSRENSYDGVSPIYVLTGLTQGFTVEYVALPRS